LGACGRFSSLYSKVSKCGGQEEKVTEMESPSFVFDARNCSGTSGLALVYSPSISVQLTDPLRGRSFGVMWVLGTRKTWKPFSVCGCASRL
jgi:hypothetical protein